MVDTARCLLLAARLRTMPDEQFNMDTWLKNRESGEFIPVFATVERVRPFVEAARTDHCGTSACVAGEAVVLFSQPGDLDSLAGQRCMFAVSVVARRLLALDAEQASALFAPDVSHLSEETELEWFGAPRLGTLPYEKSLAEVTRQQAARCLEILVETGEVNWRRAFAEEPS